MWISKTKSLGSLTILMGTKITLLKHLRMRDEPRIFHMSFKTQISASTILSIFAESM